MSESILSRRSFIQMSGAGAVAMSGLSPGVTDGGAHEKPVNPDPQTHHFSMTIEEAQVTIARDLKAKVWAYNNQVPGPLIHVVEGDTIEAAVVNNTTATHTVHWHGVPMTGTWWMDGAPGINQEAINSGGGEFTYRFVANRPGSLWYHCHVEVPNHVGVRGMWGPLIVDPLEPLPIEKEVTREAILMFTGWNSKVANDYFATEDPTDHLDFYSINGKCFPYNQPIRVKEGDVLRLRLYAATVGVAFHLHGHDMLVTHQDGLPMPAPYWADTVAVAEGQRKDVIIRMNNPGRWPAHDHNEHHLSNGGDTPGGLFTIVEYEGIESDPWYLWAKKEYDPDFYFSESLKQGYGLIEQSGFKADAVPDEAGLAAAETVQVRMMDRGPDGTAKVFDPGFVRISRGQSVEFVPWDFGHDLESVPGLIPEGAAPFSAPKNAGALVRFDKEGLYAYQCIAHRAIGMVGLIAVGHSSHDKAGFAEKIASSPELSEGARLRLMALLEKL
ncbi:multicopper oxidase domain-containing protein [Kiloniella sp. b19]|uniref:multicopper oxidase domain-containing protein n=1 Tax=Kiloniella sp. GXU_MW_B19 TaxID=3141326 RepID=UPI0031E2BD43